MSYFNSLDDDIEHAIENTPKETVEAFAKVCQEGNCRGNSHCLKGVPRPGRTPLYVCAKVVERRMNQP